MILVLDNYDSFVYTLVGYLNRFGYQTVVYRNDALTESELLGLLDQTPRSTSEQHVDEVTIKGILISPGPGTPEDAGLSKTLITAAAERGIPLLGVCLGHQAIAEVFGGTVTVAPELMHGKISTIHHDGSSALFQNVPDTFSATRYHSLAVVNSSLPATLKATATTQNDIIMALEHRSLPIWGVQFHPESFQTEYGETIVKNWLQQTQRG